MYQAIELTTHNLKLPRLAPEFNGYRIIQISDFHIGEWRNEKRLNAAIAIANRQAPDLIALTGDYVSADPPAYTGHLEKAFCRLRAADGIAAVLGNHDHHHQPQVLRSLLAACNVRDLSNTFVSLRRGDASLHIAGIDSYSREEDDLPRLLESLPTDGAAILLAHEPDFADISAASGRFDLQLSGHSHGGQVRFPLIGPVFYPRHAHKYPLGRYQINGMIQYTNRGIGLGHLPIRLNCPAEVSLFVLEAPEA
ncbi:MAG: metallophosphoesterase [Chloroflexota bacterium]